MTTVRLPAKMEQKLTSFSKVKNKSKSLLIKEALENFFYQEENKQDSYTLGEPYFGKYGNGDANLSVNYKKILKEKLHAKYDTN